MPTAQVDPDPLPVFTVAFANLGLVFGQAGSPGQSSSQAAQVVPTLAAYDQWQADISAITTMGANNSEVAGDMALLTKVGGYLEAVTTAENAIFGGDAHWLATNQTATLQQWITDFFADAEGPDGETITPAEQTQLLATTLPTAVSTSEAAEFINRWNLTVQYWTEGIVTSSQVPAGQSTDFLDAGVLATLFGAAQNAEADSQADGYADPAAEFRADLLAVANDLSGQGVCRDGHARDWPDRDPDTIGLHRHPDAQQRRDRRTTDRHRAGPDYHRRERQSGPRRILYFLADLHWRAHGR